MRDVQAEFLIQTPHKWKHILPSTATLRAQCNENKLADQRFIKDGKTCGMLFKWSPRAGSVDVADCVFRVDAMAASGPKPMRFPEGNYRDVTLVWLGDGEYPADLPDGVALTRDVEVWNAARTAWLSRHQ